VQLDPTGEFIRHILGSCDVDGKSILEVGCGSGRITRDLAARAREVTAIDPDAGALVRARAQVTAANVAFVHAGAEALDLRGRGFDVAIFTLSLHHVSPDAMDASLAGAVAGLHDAGRVVVIEPGDEGTLIEAETRFDVGDGDEAGAKAAAQAALRRLAGWSVGETVRFRTLFHFEDAADFREHLPSRRAPGPGAALERFLEEHREGDRIVLWAERRMNVLTRGRGGSARPHPERVG
jgi:SAM-dependent methyltransferase